MSKVDFPAWNTSGGISRHEPIMRNTSQASSSWGALYFGRMISFLVFSKPRWQGVHGNSAPESVSEGDALTVNGTLPSCFWEGQPYAGSGDD